MFKSNSKLRSHSELDVVEIARAMLMPRNIHRQSMFCYLQLLADLAALSRRLLSHVQTSTQHSPRKSP
jgi:hypothetical protein